MYRFFMTCALSATLITPFAFNSPAHAQGFNSLKAAGQGLGGGSGDKDDKKRSSSGNKVDKSYRNSGPLGAGGPAGLNDIVFLGVFETYLTRQRHNARISIYVEPKQFALGHRACKKITKIRDGVNTYLFSNPPKVNTKGQVNTKGLSVGLNEYIKKALKTKVDYFEHLYVAGGRYSAERPPKDLKGKSISDCEGVFAKAKEYEGA